MAAGDVGVFITVAVEEAHQFSSCMVRVANNIYAVVYAEGGGIGDRLILYTCSITDAGVVNAVIGFQDPLVFPMHATKSVFVKVGPQTYAVAYWDVVNIEKVHVATFHINDDGTIPGAFAISDAIVWSGAPAVQGIFNDAQAFFHRAGDIYVMEFQQNTSAWVLSVSISAVGVIAGLIDVKNTAAGTANNTNEGLFDAGGGLYLLAANGGFVPLSITIWSFLVTAAGAITLADTRLLEAGSVSGSINKKITLGKIALGLYAVVYSGPLGAGVHPPRVASFPVNSITGIIGAAIDFLTLDAPAEALNTLGGFTVGNKIVSWLYDANPPIVNVRGISVIFNVAGFITGTSAITDVHFWTGPFAAIPIQVPGIFAVSEGKNNQSLVWTYPIVMGALGGAPLMGNKAAILLADGVI